ncbi:MAG: twin-arginine translocation signal domain-containing protein [Candidatus Nanohaloarchaea archaeon]
MSRRKFLTGLGAAGTAAVAGCSSSGGTTDTTTSSDTTTKTETQTTTKETTTQQINYPIEDPGLEDVDINLKEKYTENIPFVSDYDSRTADLDINSLLEKHKNNRQAQVENLLVNVANQYKNGIKANSAAMQALEEELDWFTFDNNARVNKETGYSMGTGEGVLINFTDENDKHHFWDFTKLDNQDATINHNITKNIPDSELMDGDAGIALFADVEAKARGIKKYGDASKDTLENWHLGLQSILWSNDGPIDRQREGKDSHLLFDKDSLKFIDSAYSESAEAARQATDKVNELYLKADQKYDLTEEYLELGVENGELTGKRVLNEDQAQEVIYNQSRYEVLN